MQCHTSLSHRFDKAVNCGMLNSSSMVVLRYWRELEHAVTRRFRASQTCSTSDLYGEYAGHGRSGPFSASRNCVQIVATWGIIIIIMLKHEVITEDEWHDNGPQDLVMVSICIQLSWLDLLPNSLKQH